jgi:hypothetical protein
LPLAGRDRLSGRRTADDLKDGSSAKLDDTEHQLLALGRCLSNERAKEFAANFESNLSGLAWTETQGLKKLADTPSCERFRVPRRL